MSIYRLKPAFQNALRPLVQSLAHMGVTANQVTLFAAAVSVVYGGLIWWSGGGLIWFALLPILLFVRMALNAIDGMLAREHGQQSKLGAYLNEICDLVADAALIAPFLLLAPFDGFWIVLIILTAWLAEFVGILGETVGATRRYDGPLGKSDRALIFGVLGVLAWAFGGLSPVFYWTQPLIVISLMVTCFNRARAALGEAR